MNLSFFFSFFLVYMSEQIINGCYRRQCCDGNDGGDLKWIRRFFSSCSATIDCAMDDATLTSGPIGAANSLAETHFLAKFNPL